jgi:pimeloyl-ACP methyl ester carboxylesterase
MDPDDLLADVPAPDPGLEPEGFVVDVDGTRIHFLDWGGGAGVTRGGPPGVLLIHGLAQTAWTWAPVARRLARIARTVAMDLRGHGLSDAPTDEYELGLLAEDAIAVIEGAALAADRGVVIAGHGFGGIVASWTAGSLEAEGSGRVSGLVLVDGGWEDIAATSGMEPEEFLPGLDEPPEVLRSMGAFLADRRDFDPATWDVDQERAARATVVEVPAGHLVPATRPHALAAAVRAMFEYRPDAVLPGLDLPIAALVSDDPDGVRREALAGVTAQRALAGRGSIAVMTFPGTGHNLMRYRPAEVSAAILEVARTIGR